MKKIYSLLLAVAATAMVANAAAPVAKMGTMSRELAPKAEFTNVKTAVSRLGAAPAKATAAPASLNNKTYMCTFVLVEEGMKYNMSTDVTFTNEDIDQGIYYYDMTNIFEGLYNTSVGTPSLEVAYLPSSGELMLLADQTYLTVPLTSGGTAELSLWLERDNEGLYQVSPIFSFNNGAFVFDNPQLVFTSEDADEPEEFNIVSILTGMRGTGGVSVFSEMTPDVKFIEPGNGSMTYSKMMSTGAVESQQVSVTGFVDGNGLTVYNFADMVDVPMTVDVANKTLTATDVTFGRGNIGNTANPVYVSIYLSAATNNGEDATNAAGYQKYELTSKYVVENGKTTIVVPDWNGFFTHEQLEKKDYAFWYPFSNTTITLDLDVEAQYLAGVNEITTAPAAADVNAPVEYFNLQGVRVAEPAAGLYIRRQGNEVSKVIIR